MRLLNTHLLATRSARGPARVVPFSPSFPKLLLKSRTGRGEGTGSVNLAAAGKAGREERLQRGFHQVRGGQVARARPQLAALRVARDGACRAEALLEVHLASRDTAPRQPGTPQNNLSSLGLTPPR